MFLPWSILPSGRDFQPDRRRNGRNGKGKRSRRLSRGYDLVVEALEERTTPAAPNPLSISNWVPVGPAPIVNGQTLGENAPVTGRISAVAAHPTDPDTIYIGAAGGGVWKTTDGGATWTPLTDDPAGVPANLRSLFIGALAIAPSNPNVIYAGTGEPNNANPVLLGTNSVYNGTFYGRGVLRSNDGGQTWTLLGNTEFDRRTISQIVVDPNNPDIVYVAVADNGSNGVTGNTGIWKSVNGGVTWTNTTAGIAGATESSWTDLIMDPNNPQVLYAGAGGYQIGPHGALEGKAVNGVYKTTNGGSTWTRVPDLPNGYEVANVKLAISKASSQIIYVAFDNRDYDRTLPFPVPEQDFTDTVVLFKSVNGGINWRQLFNTPDVGQGQQFYNLSLAVDPSDPNVIYAGGKSSPSIVKSSDGGLTWFNIDRGQDGEGPHVDHHSQNQLGVFDAQGRFLTGTDGGLWRLDSSTFGAIDWTNLNGNLQITQFIGIALHPTDPNIAYGGSQDNGTEIFRGDLGWTQVRGGDGGVVRVDPRNPNTVYRASIGANIERSDDGGLTWTSRSSGIGGFNANFYVPLALDPSFFDPNDPRVGRLLVGTDRISETLDRGDSWSPVGQGPLYPINPFVGHSIDSIAISPADQATVYVGVGGRIYVSRNATQGTNATFDNRTPPINPNLTDLNWQDIIVAPGDGDLDGDLGDTAIAVAANFRDFDGDGGNEIPGQVWITFDYGINWTNITGNLPDLPVWSVELDPQDPNNSLDDIVYVGTDDGVYKVQNPITATWTRFEGDPANPAPPGTPNLPRGQVRDLELNKNLGILAAGLHGRGMWQISLLKDPYVTQSTPTDFVTPSVDYIDFSFDQDMDPASFDLNLDVVRFEFTDTNGTVFDISNEITGFQWLDSKTLRIEFNARTSEGTYELEIGPNIQAADDGARMDQNRDATPGLADDSYTAVFKISTPQTFKVDALGGGDYTTIQDALAAAEANFGPDNIIVFGNGTLANTVPYIIIDPGFTGLNNLVVEDVNITFRAKTPGGQDAPLVVKFLHNIVDVVNSEFRIEGSANAPVVFTSWVDDSVGGDSNNDGNASAPNRKDWGGIRFRGTAVDQGPTDATGSLINYLDIRYTGETLIDPARGDFTEFSSIRMEFDNTTRDSAQIRVWNTTFRKGGKAIDVELRALEGRGPDIGNGNGIDPTDVEGTAIVPGIGRQPLTFEDNSINGIFVNIPFLQDPQLGPRLAELTVDSRWDDVSAPYVISERLVLGSDFLTRQAGSLTIDPGMVIKVQRNAIDATAEGTSLYVNGTEQQPVVFTALTNDYFNPSYPDGSNGDTNNDGTLTQPQPGDWGGIRVGDGWIDHAIISFGGGQVPISGFPNGFQNQSALAILTQDYRPTDGPLQSFRLSNTEITQTFKGIIDGVEVSSAALSVGIDPLTEVRDPRNFTPIRSGIIQVIDNYIHDNQGLSIWTGPNVYTDMANPLGGYGVHFRRNVLENNEVNGIYTVWSQSNFGPDNFNLDSVDLGMPLKSYLDDTDIVQTIPALPDNGGIPNDNVIQINRVNQVLQVMSRRGVTPVNSFLDQLQGTGTGPGSAFDLFISALTAQGVEKGPLPANGDNGLFYYLVDFENTARGVAVPGVGQNDPGNLRGEEWRDWGVDFATMAASGVFPLKARANTAGDPDFITPVSGANVLTTAHDNDSSLELIFPNRVSAVGFWIVDNEVTSPNERIEFYGEDNVLLETIPLPTTLSGPVFVGRISRQPIYRVNIVEDPDDQVGSFFTTGTLDQAIPDTNTDFVTILPVAGLPNNISDINDLNLQLNITHTQNSDLEIQLEAPNGQLIKLISQGTGSGQNFRDTVFDDDAAIPINLGTGPYADSFRPEVPLSDLFSGNFNPNGAWKLRIKDATGGGTGTLHYWNLTFRTTGPNALPPDIAGIDDLYYVDAGQSMVIKVDGTNNGIVSAGGGIQVPGGDFSARHDGVDFLPGELAVGGTLRIMGQPRSPVVVTHISDDTVGAGIVGNVVTDTNNDGSATTPGPGDWRGIEVLQGSNASRIENVVQVGGTIIRSPSDLNPYTIGDEPGSDTDLLENGNEVNVQDGTLIEHSNIRYADIGIEVQGYPDSEMTIDRYEQEPNDGSAQASPLKEFIFTTFNTSNGALRGTGFIGDEHLGAGFATTDVDFYTIPDPVFSTRLNISVDHTLNDSPQGSFNIFVFNSQRKLIYANSRFLGFFGIVNDPFPNSPVPPSGNFLGPVNVMPDQNGYSCQAPIRDAQYVVITNSFMFPDTLVDPPGGNIHVFNRIPGGEGYTVTLVDSNGNCQDLQQRDTFELSGPAAVTGAYEFELTPADFTVPRQNRDLDAVRNSEGEWIFRQNVIQDFQSYGVYHHDTTTTFQAFREGAGNVSFTEPDQAARYAYKLSLTDQTTGQNIWNPRLLIPGVQIYNNLIRNGEGDGIRVETISTINPPNLPAPTPHDQIINNTIHGMTDAAIAINTRGGDLVLNNILTGSNVGLDVNDLGDVDPGFRGVSRTYFAYNLLFQNGQDYGPNTLGDINGSNNLTGQDPQYVDVGGGDFRIFSTSPAVDSAISDLADQLSTARDPDHPTRAPNDDFRLRARLDNPSKPNVGAGQFPFFDRGAFESNEPSLRVAATSLFATNGVLGGPIATFTVTFTGRVNPATVSPDTVRVTQGGTNKTISGISNSYDPVRDLHVFTFTFQDPLDDGDYCLKLDGVSVNASDPAIRDIAGQVLDGEFNGQSFPSGNSIPGGDFDLCFTIQTSSIGDLVWNDIDGNGVQDAGEPGLANVRINLVSAGADQQLGTADDVAVGSQVTNTNGFYEFVNIQPGLYRVSVDPTSLPANFLLTTGNEPLDVSLSVGEKFTTADFGYREDLQNAIIGDLVWDDLNGNGVRDTIPFVEPGLGGVKIDLVGRGRDLIFGTSDDIIRTVTTNNTNNPGFYQFTSLPGGRYRITVDTSTLPPGYGLTTGNQPLEIEIQPGENFDTADFGYQLKNSTIGDLVFNDLDNSGSFTPGDTPFPNVTVFVDEDNDGIFDPGEPSDVTDANGNYTIGGLGAGTHTVRVVIPAGYVVTTSPYPRTVTFTSGSESATDVDFGLLLDPVTASIGDRVFEDLDADGTDNGGLEPGLVGVTVFLDNDNDGTLDPGEPSDVTDANGNYSFTNLAAGTYYVRVDESTLPAGPNFVRTTPVNLPLVVNLGPAQNFTDADFGYQDRRATIGDRVWNDEDGDGIQDPGEAGINNVRVNLQWAGPDGILDNGDDVFFGPVTTSGDGNYSFTNLAVGLYRVTVDTTSTPLQGFVATTPNPLQVNVNTSTEVISTADFGFRQQNSEIRGQVFVDTNGNGVRDPNELLGLDNQRIFIDLIDNDVFDAGEPSAITDMDGNYALTGLAAGVYEVRIDTNSGNFPPGATITTTHPLIVNVPTGNSIVQDQDFGVTGVSSGLFYLTVSGKKKLKNSDGTKLRITPSDIVKLRVFTDGSWQYSIYFRGADVGLTNSNEAIDAFTFLPDGDLIISFAGTFSVRQNYNSPGNGSGNTFVGFGEDLMRFTPTQVNGPTAGSWSFYFDGSSKGLSGSSENIDAVDILDDGTLLISTTGNASLPGGVTGTAQDVLAFNQASNTWSPFFRGSRVGLSNSKENIDALFVPNRSATLPTLNFSTKGKFSVPGLSGKKADLFAFIPSSLEGIPNPGSTTSGTFDPNLVLRGKSYKIKKKANITGAFVGVAPGPQPLVASGTDAAELPHLQRTVRWPEGRDAVTVFVDGRDFDPEASSRLDDAIRELNRVWAATGGLQLTQVADAAQADIRIDLEPTTLYGGVEAGVLGATILAYDAGIAGWSEDGQPFSELVGHELGAQTQITLVAGWNWYTGADVEGIGSDQFDLQSVVAHELGHAIGLPESSVAGGVMFHELAAGQVRRTYSAADIASLADLYERTSSTNERTGTSETTGEESAVDDAELVRLMKRVLEDRPVSAASPSAPRRQAATRTTTSVQPRVDQALADKVFGDELEDVTVLTSKRRSDDSDLWDLDWLPQVAL